jgi:AraC-like DNA-binding protein/quercetin dioxygenase-like cupin family protein
MSVRRSTGEFSVRRVGSRQVVAVEARSSDSFQRHTHEDYGIGLMLAGAQRSLSGRGYVEAGAGDLITVNPGEVHDGVPIGGSRRWVMLYVPPSNLDLILSDIEEGRSREFVFVQPAFQHPEMAQRFASAYWHIAAPETCADMAEERLMLLFAGMTRDMIGPRPASLSTITRAQERIDDDPASRHSLDELAALESVSKFQLIRSFARRTGLTPQAYVVQRRLDLARSLIRTGAALADAASAAGFADQSHFHRAFTRRYGLTPGAFAIAVR